ncbi:MAG: hypothetical protein ACXV2D_02170 [Halobacteriota archaeon]
MKNNKYALKMVMVSLGALYVIASMLPKHEDYWKITNVSMGFAVNPANFMRIEYVTYPPTFYILQGIWLRGGASLLHYSLTFNTVFVNSTLSPYWATSFGIFPFWGMIPSLAALFLLVGVSYTALQNKWLTLLCFGPISFVAVIFMGQIDVFCALFIFISLLLMQKALSAHNYFSLLLLAYLSLGMSVEFKIYGAALLPVYLVYTVALVKDRKLDLVKSSFTALTGFAAFTGAALIVWIPYRAWFNMVMFGGSSRLGKPSLLFQSLGPVWLTDHTLLVWLIGYALILCYMAVRVLVNPKQALQDKRYFTFYSFSIAAWFLIAVFTHPQWWMFLVPVALFSLDNFRNKSVALLCVLTSALFLVYPLYWGEIAKLYSAYFGWLGVTALYTLSRSVVNPAFAWAHVLLTGSLLLWIGVMLRELRIRKPVIGHQNEEIAKRM